MARVVRLLFSFGGRMRRSMVPLALRMSGAILGLGIVLVGAALLLPLPAEAELAVGGAALVPVAWAWLAIAAKRLHDMDRTAWHLAWVTGLSLIPAALRPDDVPAALRIGLLLLALAAWAWILLTPGTPGPNRFGEQPEPDTLRA